MNKGQVFGTFLGEIQKTVTDAKKIQGLDEMAVKLETAANRLGETAILLGQKAMSLEFKVAFAHSQPFLEAMAIRSWGGCSAAIDMDNDAFGGV